MRTITVEEMNAKINALLMHYTSIKYNLVVEDYDDKVTYNLSNNKNSIVMDIKKEPEELGEGYFGTAMSVNIVAENENVYFEIVNTIKDYLDGAEDITGGTSKLN